MPFILEYTNYPGQYVRSPWTVQSKEEQDRKTAYDRERGRPTATKEELLLLQFATKKIECAKRWNTKKQLERFKQQIIRSAGGFELTIGPSGQSGTWKQSTADLSDYTVVEIELVQKGKGAF